MNETPPRGKEAASIATVYVTHQRRAYPLRTPENTRWVARSIFEQGEYALLGLPAYRPRNIVDVGAHVGAFSLYAALHYPGVPLYAYEPVASSFALLEENLRDFKEVVLTRAGLLDRDTRCLIHAGRNNPGESSILRGAEQAEPTEEVEMRRASGELAAHGLTSVGVLKIDTEGCELAILHDLEAVLPRVDFLLVEYHLDTDRRAIDSLMGTSFLLYGGRAQRIHRGVLKYVNRSLAESHPPLKEYLDAEEGKKVNS